MKEEIIANIDLLHSTDLGIERIKRNLNLNNDNVVKYLIEKIKCNNSVVYRKGKNYYCEIEDIIITINSYNYCIITAHIK